MQTISLKGGIQCEDILLEHVHFFSLERSLILGGVKMFDAVGIQQSYPEVPSFGARPLMKVVFLPP